MHRIRRQILELELPRQQDAVALQRRAAAVFQEKVLPALDEVFGRLAPGEAVLRIERLDLDLGELPERGWERAFVEQCVRQIERAVAEKHAEAEIGEASPEAARWVSGSMHAVEIMQFFLKKGALPWFAKDVPMTKTGDEIRVALEQSSPSAQTLGRQLRRFFVENPTAVQRLWLQFSEETAQQIFTRPLDLETDFLKKIEKHAGAKQLTVNEKARIAEHVLAEVSKNRTPRAEDVAAVFFEKKPTAAPAAESFFSKNKNDTPPTEAPQTTDRNAELPEIKNQKSKIKNPEAEFVGLHCENAGVVLLGPYLGHFFRALRLLGERDFQDENARERAVHLLHFVATGEENPEEERLVLQKILCGMAVETPVARELPLTEAEKTEATNLLEAVLGNWPALKNTSPDGLRDAFLRRPGLVGQKDDGSGWLLRVERQGIDVLLERLPWGYGMLRFSWMEGLVWVEW